MFACPGGENLNTTTSRSLEDVLGPEFDLAIKLMAGELGIPAITEKYNLYKALGDERLKAIEVTNNQYKQYLMAQEIKEYEGSLKQDIKRVLAHFFRRF